MDRSAPAKRIKQAFLDALGKLDLSVETMDKLAAESEGDKVRGIFRRLGQADREVYLVRGVGLMNLHVRSKPPGWWNVLKTVKDDLDWVRRDLKIGCYYVCLVGRPDDFVADGYIFSDFSYPPFKRPPGEEETKYSINERQHLVRSKVLPSVEKIAAALAAYRKPKEHESTGESSAF